MSRYIYHVTTGTGHARKSPKSEIADGVVKELTAWVKDMLNGDIRAVFEDKYCCRTEMRDSKMCEFVISRIDEQFVQTDIIRFVVCRHSRNKKAAWALVVGQGEPPETPFCAVELIYSNILPDDMQYIPMFADFERCIAWAWLDMMEGDND